MVPRVMNLILKPICVLVGLAKLHFVHHVEHRWTNFRIVFFVQFLHLAPLRFKDRHLLPGPTSH